VRSCQGTVVMVRADEDEEHTVHKGRNQTKEMKKGLLNVASR